MRKLTAEGLAAAVADLIGRPLGPDEPFAVAVSGGPDSLALLLLAHAAYGLRVRALTVDHALRASSSGEAADVAGLCAERNIPHATLRWEGDKPSGNIQAEARAARYRLMADWCEANGVRWLATAHHADDQAETLLMRLSRGAGIGGLAGTRATRPLSSAVTLIRPVLAARRASLSAVVAEAGLSPVDDPANRDPRYDRTAARSLLRDTAWLDPPRVSASAAHLADAEAALAWAADAAWRSRATVGDGKVTIDAAGLPRELQRRLILRALITFRATPDGPETERMLAALNAGRTATLGPVKAVGGLLWRFEPALPRRAAPRPR